MLDLMRRQSYLIYLVFGGIIFIFAINFGPGSSGCMKAAQQPWAARVNGETIRQQEFALLYGRQLEYMRRLAARSGSDFDAAMADRMGLRKQVIDQLVERRLLAQQAEARGILVSDAELLTFLREQYGVKDVTYETYANWVTRTFDTSVSRFEDDARHDIAAQRMARLLTDSLVVGTAELHDEFDREHDRAMVSFARFDPEPGRQPPPDVASIERALHDEAAAVQAAYDQDSMGYRTALEMHARQIVRKLGATATDAEVAAAKALLVGLREQVEKGADFAALAAQHSQDEATSHKGGDLGWVKRGQLARPLEAALVGLQPQAMAPEPVRTPEGLHLVQMLKRKEPARQPFADVQRQVAASLLRERAAKARAQEAAQALLAQLKAGKRWEDVTVDEDLVSANAPATRPVRRDSPWILRTQESLPRIGQSKELQAAIFALSEKAPVGPQVYAVGTSLYVVRLKARETPDVHAFAAAQASLQEDALSAKRNRVLHDWLGYLRNHAKVDMNAGLLTVAAEASGAPTGS